MTATTLWRPAGPEELRPIRPGAMRACPPRLPEQPILYPVTTGVGAVGIARAWNVPAGGAGYVTRFGMAATASPAARCRTPARRRIGNTGFRRKRSAPSTPLSSARSRSWPSFPLATGRNDRRAAGEGLASKRRYEIGAVSVLER